MGPVERFLQRNSIFHQEIRKMAQSKSENMPEIKSEDFDVLRAEAGHEDGGGGPTLSSDALYDDDTSRNDLNALAASFGVEYPEAYPSKKSLRKAAVEA
jgi:hypothetical protein